MKGLIVRRRLFETTGNRAEEIKQKHRIEVYQMHLCPSICKCVWDLLSSFFCSFQSLDNCLAESPGFFFLLRSLSPLLSWRYRHLICFHFAILGLFFSSVFFVMSNLFNSRLRHVCMRRYWLRKCIAYLDEGKKSISRIIYWFIDQPN